MATQIQNRRDTAANWSSKNPVLADGEIVVEKDTKKLKVGDGTTAYNSLNYVADDKVDQTTTINGQPLTSNIVIAKSDIGLTNVDNTSDANKPISTATQTALNAKATDSAVVHLSNSETIAGVKTFSLSPVVPDAYYPFEVTNRSQVLGFLNNYASLDQNGLVPQTMLPPYPIPKLSVRVASKVDTSVSAAPAQIDGVTLNIGDRVLLVNQANGAENGIYLYNGSGNAMTRSDDADTDKDLYNAFVYVDSGTSAQAGYRMTTPLPITIGTTNLTWGTFVSAASMVTSVYDDLGQLALTTRSIPSAVNYVRVWDAATGARPRIDVEGSDANIGLELKMKGTGGLLLTTSTSGASDLNITNTANDAQITVTAAAVGKGVFFNLNSQSTQYNLLRLQQNGTNIGGSGRFGQSAGYHFFSMNKYPGGSSLALGATLDDTQNFITRGGQFKKRTTVVDTNYTVTVNDLVVAYSTLTAARTVTLPAVAGTTSSITVSGTPTVTVNSTQHYSFKDETGTAATNNITIVPSGTSKIDDASSYVINSNYGKVTLYSNGTDWFTI